MDPQRVLACLLVLAERLGVEVKQRALRGAPSNAGGLCRVKGKNLILLNSKASPVDRSIALADALGSFDLSRVELDAEVRTFLVERKRHKVALPALTPARISGPGLASTGPMGKRRSRLP